LVTGGADKSVRLWKAATGEPVGTPLLHQGAVNTVAFSPDARWILSGSADQSARLWDGATGKPIGMPFVHQGGVRAAAFSPDGSLVLTGCEDETVRLWALPRPVAGSPDQLLCWAETITGMELGNDGILRGLDPNRFKQRSQRLEQLGGPPSP